MSGLSNYYDAFNLFIGDSSVISSGTWSHSNFGFYQAIEGINWRVGRYASGNYMKDNCKIDALAVWDIDLSSSISALYNSGVPFDFMTLSNQPKHFYPVDGSTYPVMQDEGTEANCDFVMYNMTAADIVSDVP